MNQTYRVGEEIQVPLGKLCPTIDNFPNVHLVHSDYPKKHFVVTEINEAEGSITLASALVNEREDL
jgi:hypothetical protein